MSHTIGLPRGAETELQATLEKVGAQAKGIRQAATRMKALQGEKDDKKRKEEKSSTNFKRWKLKANALPLPWQKTLQP